MQLRDVTRKVKLILESNEAARNSDDILYAAVIKRYAEDMGIDIDKYSILYFLATRCDMHYPPFESVSRIRRRVQEKYPHLRATADVEAMRMLEEEKYREYAHEVIV